MDKDHGLQLPDQLLTVHRLPQPLWPNLQVFRERHLQSQQGLLPESEGSVAVVVITAQAGRGRCSCDAQHSEPCCRWCRAAGGAVLPVPGVRLSHSLRLALVYKPMALKEGSSEQTTASICISAFCEETESTHCPWCVTLPSSHTSQSTVFASRHHRTYAVCLPAGMDLQCCWC